MENINEHSKAKLALAIFTSPGPAFEEINRRKLLGDALMISAITGTVAMIPPLVAYFSGERLQWLTLSQYNPIAWIGLTMLYVFVMQKMLKWIGAQVDFVPLLTLMGWAQLSMLMVQIGVLSLTIAGVTGNATLASAGMAGTALFSLWYVLLMGSAIQALVPVNRLRGILTYVVVHGAIWIGLSNTYVSTRVSGFPNATAGVLSAVQAVGSADRLPWAVAAVLGLAIGASALAKHFELPSGRMKAYAAGSALLGLVIFAIFAYALHQAGHYGRLRQGYIYAVSQQYDKAAHKFEQFAPMTKDNSSLLYDIGNLHYLAGNDKEALKSFRRAADKLEERGAWEKDKWLARAWNGVGAVYDQQGKHDEAIKQFEKASKSWPEFREPWVRKAVTLNRMGKYDKALEAADHAMKKLDSEATVAWAAFAQASVQTDKTEQAKAAIAIVKERDEKLAARLGKSLDDWKTAVDRLTREDLKYPLEKEPAPPPKQPKAKAPEKQAEKPADKAADQPKPEGK